VVVTGASSGIGLAAACALAARGDDLVLLGRHPGRLGRAVDRVRAAGGRTPLAVAADFVDLAQVRAAAQRLRSELPQVHVLVNNAGGLRGIRRTTVDGMDATMQVNHLGGFLLANLLVDRLQAAATAQAPARVITTGSLAEAWGWLDVDRPMAPLRRYWLRWLAYGTSKQANLLFTVEAGRRWGPDGIVATCFFPGLVRSRFGGSSPLFWLARLVPGLTVSSATAAQTLVWLATDPAALIPGGYFAFGAPFVATPRSTDPVRAARLWTASLAAAGLA
jgi:NAD(P)-dependent dehydrogenase (short-subunit alcohol dehydrogenase family)